MALGYGWKEERGLKPGTPIPAKVEKSRWRRIGLVYWAIFNVLATIAASGKVPSRDFRL